MNLEEALKSDMANLKLTECTIQEESPSSSRKLEDPKKVDTPLDLGNQQRVEKLLNRIIDNNYERNKVGKDRLDMVEYLRQKIEKRLRQCKHFGEDARVSVFGSLASGLGTNTSDIDLCVRIKEDEVPSLTREQRKDYVSNLVEPLRSLGFRKIEPILNCRVPIVKFECKPNEKTTFEVDICFYNILSIHNTELIKKYCEWEPERLPKLILFIKKWAKRCNIGSASQGSLSSYAYIIMIIYYLQNTEPPVLPKLQEQDLQDDNCVSEMVDGTNVYFKKTVTQNWSRNEASEAELFIGFMNFYASFPYSKKLISISGRTSPTNDESKIVHHRRFRIQDPFDLEHNLGKIVRNPMTEFIIETMLKTFKFFTVRFGCELLVELENEKNLDVIEARLLRICFDNGKAPVRKLGYRNKGAKQIKEPKRKNFNHAAQQPPPQFAYPPRYFNGSYMMPMYPPFGHPPPPFGHPPPLLPQYNPYDYQGQFMPPPPMWGAPPMVLYPQNQNRHKQKPSFQRK